MGDNGFNLKVRSFLNKGGGGGGGRVVCSAGICGLNVVGRLTPGGCRPQWRGMDGLVRGCRGLGWGAVRRL